MTEPAANVEEYDLTNQRAAMEVLFRERKTLGMSLGDWEEKSGVSINSAYSYRTMKRDPSLGKLLALAQVLGFKIVMVRR